MKTLLKISMATVLVIFVAGTTDAQTVTVTSDTLKSKVESKEAGNRAVSDDKGNEVSRQARSGLAGDQGKGVARQARNQATGNQDKAVKQVKSARPDMSKATGARPPVIVRPGGSVIPKGVGKPAGAGKKGGR